MGIEQENESPRSWGVCNSPIVPVQGLKHGDWYGDGGQIGGLRERFSSRALEVFFPLDFFFFLEGWTGLAKSAEEGDQTKGGGAGFGTLMVGRGGGSS